MRLSTVRQILTGIFVAFTSCIFVMGSLYLAASEQRTVQASMARSSLVTPTLIPSPLPRRTLPIAEAAQATQPLKTRTPLPTPTLPPPPSDCPPPQGWSPLVIQPGDTLVGLAQAYGVSAEVLAKVNCLMSSSLLPDTIIYVPGQPAGQPTAQCGPPPGWIFYTVRPGDTLARLSYLYSTTVEQLQLANCMGDSTLLRSGQQLYVPNVPTRPAPPPIIYPTATLLPSETAVPTSQEPVASATPEPPLPWPTITNTPPLPTATSPLPTATTGVPVATSTTPQNTPGPSATSPSGGVP